MPQKEEIAIIGAGLGGCLTALMLAKDPKYHVTLIEAQGTLLNGASAIASRLHLGGEYPLDPGTAQDCLSGALIWKLLMPNHALDERQENIFTSTPPMKFLVGQKTQKYGQEHPEDEKALTLEKYVPAYEKIRLAYKDAFKKIGGALGWSEETTQKALFGSYEDEKFFRSLKPEEYTDYAAQVAGGFQSQEQGLNVPKYLAMIESELEAQEQRGNITILRNHKVKKNGIEPHNDKFVIHCENGSDIEASQVVQAAWQGGPALTKLGAQEDKLKGVTVSKRAMLLVDLAPGFKTPPAFIMLGDDGGMLAPYNDKVAICYLPPEREWQDGEYHYSKPAAYIKECLLTDENGSIGTKPSLPSDWDSWNQPMQFLGGYLGNNRGLIPDTTMPAWKYLSPEQKWTKVYFELLKRRFPVLEGATNPRLIIRDTLNFQKDIHFRRHEAAEEAEGIVPAAAAIALSQRPMMLTEMLMLPDDRPAILEDEEKRGLFTLYPTKATYSVHAALQAVAMVKERSELNKKPEASARQRRVRPPADVLDLLFVRKNEEEYDVGQSQRNLEAYSLSHMKEPDQRFYARFFREHPDLDPKMMKQTWPDPQKSGTHWADQSLCVKPYDGRL